MSRSLIKELLLKKLQSCNEEFTVLQLAMELYRTEPTILNHLKTLQELGLVERIKKSRIRAATWKYINNPTVQNDRVNRYE